MSLIHFAGVDVQIGPYLRQRCSWCGAVLIDYNLDRVMVPVGQEPGGPGTWPISALVVVDGPMSTVVEHVDGDPLPPGTCADLEWIAEAVDGIAADLAEPDRVCGCKLPPALTVVDANGDRPAASVLADAKGHRLWCAVCGGRFDPEATR